MLAIIGGSGLYTPGQDFILGDSVERATPYGETSAEILIGEWQGHPIVFLSRHGATHEIPPHRVNYRANIWGLKQQGVTRIVVVNAVGGISEAMSPRSLVLPDQIIDYTSAREHSFFNGGEEGVQHTDFSTPYSARMRALLRQVAARTGQTLIDGATYACTNGPRFETAAEIARLRNDGCDIVGMTAMPEAILAREIEIEYASIALVVNWAAGINEGLVGMPEILENLEQGMHLIRPLLLAAAGETDA